MGAVVVPAVEFETKTARRKRMKAERAGGKKSPSVAQIESLKARFLQRCCSEYWFYRRAASASTPTGKRCFCIACSEARRYGWPRPHVGSVGISFDCFVEGTDIEPNDPAYARDRAVHNGEAMGAGMTIKRRRQRPPAECQVLVAGCEGCEDGMKPRGERYCMKCRAIMKQRMADDGYFE